MVVGRERLKPQTNEGLEESLPGLGVFMEIIWKYSNEETKKELLETLKAHLN